MSAPTLLCDVDGTYLGADRKLHKADGWNNYETCSLWDTYRAAHPLYDILMPARAGEMVNSLIAFSKENGRLPIWNMWSSETDMMIGYHAASVIAEAILKGVPNINKEEALAECVKTANLDDYRGIGLYKKLGYVPYDVKEPTLGDDWSLSRTLEYAYDDACIAALAKSMNKTTSIKSSASAPRTIAMCIARVLRSCNRAIPTAVSSRLTRLMNIQRTSARATAGTTCGRCSTI